MKQACQAPLRLARLADDPVFLADWLLELLTFVTRRSQVVGSGVTVLGPHALIYWPDVVRQPAPLESLHQRLFTPVELQQTPDVSTLDGFTRWADRLKQRAVRLTQALQVRAPDEDYLALVRQYQRQFVNPHLALSPALLADHNYLVFRLVRPHRDVARRVLLSPGIERAHVFAEPDATPGALLALYAASTLYHSVRGVAKAHWAKVAFEKWFLAKRSRGRV